MKRWAVLLIGALLLVVGSITISAQRPRIGHGDDEAVKANAIAAEVAELKSEVQRVKAARILVLPAHQARGDATGDEEQHVSEPTAEAEAIPPELRQAQTAADLEERLVNEPRDVAWSAEMTTQINDAVSAKAPGARLLDTACGTSLCRVVLGHDSIEDQRNIGHSLVAVEPFRNGVFYDYDEQATPPRTTLYVLREGYSFRN